MELSNTVVYLKVFNSETVLNYLLAEFSLKMNEKSLNGTHFCYNYLLDRETGLPVHRNMSRLVVLPVHLKSPKKVLSIILTLQQASKTTKKPFG